MYLPITVMVREAVLCGGLQGHKLIDFSGVLRSSFKQVANVLSDVQANRPMRETLQYLSLKSCNAWQQTLPERSIDAHVHILLQGLHTSNLRKQGRTV